jgi:hypothetical protein
MNILSPTFNILQSKGYTGSADLFEIIHWLESKNIYLDLISCWDGDNLDIFTGYTITFWFPPHKGLFKTPLLNSYEDCLEAGIIYFKDYL